MNASPRFKLVSAALDFAAYQALARLAEAQGETVNDLAERLLTAIAQADRETAPPTRAPSGRPEKIPDITPGQLETARRLRKSRFSTADIARLLKVSEASVANALGRK